jgi:outer membrane lipoprotein-sorting protein
MRILAALLALCSIVFFPSCASNNEDFQDRMDRRNEAYSDFNERRKIRLQARQERTDMWFDRVMGN